MALAPISQISTTYDQYPNYWLKGYAQGTATPISMATDSTGGTLLAKAEISAGGTVPIGFIKTAGDAIFIPYYSEAYDLFLFPTEAEADANDTSNAIQVADNMAFLVDFANQVGAARAFTNVAAMVAATDLSVGNYATTAGYLTAGDGGDNFYKVVNAATGTDDGGEYIDLATHQANGLFPNGIRTVKQWGAVQDGSTDTTTEVQAAIDACANKVLDFNSGSLSYIVAGIVTITSPITIKAYGAIIEWDTNAANQGLKVTSSDVHIYGGEWKGPDVTGYTATQLGIWFEGTNPATYLTNLTLKDAEVHNWGGENVRFRMCQYFEASGNYVHTGRSNGINMLSCLDGKVYGNTVENFTGDTTPEAWGISMTKNTGTIAVWPQTKRVTVTGNTVRDILIWTGIDTHGGEDLVISGNVVYDCLLGIVVTRYDDATNKYAPKNVAITGNTITNDNIALSGTSGVGNGIQVVGSSSTVVADGITVTGNTITNHGRQAGTMGGNNFSAAIYLSRYENVTLSNNIMRDSGTHGIYCDLMGTQLNGTGNIISGLTDPTTGSAVYFDGDGLTADGRLEGTIIEVTGFIGVFCQTDTAMDMINTKFQAATTNWDHAVAGGTVACTFLGRVDPVHVGSATWDPASIAANASSSTSITAIPGCSSLSLVADIGVNRDLQGMTPHTVTADTDANVGTFTYYLYNNTSGAIDLASLNILYKIIKP